MSAGGMRYAFAADLVGNTICADLLDYLLRDHLYTGLPAAIGHRFTSAFFIVPARRGPYSERVALNIMQDGYERTDVLSELLKALRYRYELSERALYHHAKLAADVMVGKALDLWARAVWLEHAAPVIATLDAAEEQVEALDHYGLRGSAERALDEFADTHRHAAAGELQGAQADAHEHVPSSAMADELSSAPRADGAELDPAISALIPTEGPAGGIVLERQQKQLEDEVLGHGDDGLLERIAALGADPPCPGVCGAVIDDLRRQAAALGRALLDRELFAIGGRVGVDDAPAAKLWDAFGSIEQRTAAQDEAQRFAEVGRDPQVLIWLPDPEMRLKLARVLVDNGEHINEFQAYEEARGGRGADIYRAHRRLWSLWVFCHRSMTIERQDAALAYLAVKYGVAWERMRDRYGSDARSWIVRYGLSRLLELPPLDARVTELISHAEQLAARGPSSPTVSDLMTALARIPEVAAAMGARNGTEQGVNGPAAQ